MREKRGLDSDQGRSEVERRAGDYRTQCLASDGQEYQEHSQYSLILQQPVSSHFTMSMFSRSGAAGAPADQNAKKLEVMTQVKQELEVARLQELINVSVYFVQGTSPSSRTRMLIQASHVPRLSAHARSGPDILETTARPLHQNMTQRCYTTCQPSGSALSSKDQTCLSNCMGESLSPLYSKFHSLS